MSSHDTQPGDDPRLTPPYVPAAVPWRWLLFGMVLGLGVLTLISLPHQLGRLMLTMLLITSGAIGLRLAIRCRRELRVRNLRRLLRQALGIRPAVMLSVGGSALSLALFFRAAWMMLPGPDITLARQGLREAVLATAIMGGAQMIDRMRRPESDAAAPPRPAVDRSQPRPQWVYVGIGVAALALLAHANIVEPLQPALFSHHLQMLLFVGGIVLTAWGLGGGRPGWRAMARAHHTPAGWKHLLVACSLALFALILRTWNLEQGIAGLVDESHFMDAVGRLWYRGHQPVLNTHSGTVAFTWIYPYTQSITAGLTGASLTGLRLASALYGVGQVFVIYYLVRALFHWRVALVAALLLATFPPHLHFSRIGLNNIADPFFGLLALWMLVRGLRRGQVMDFALAGAALGLTHYFYEGGRVFFTVFVLLWLAWYRLFVWRGLVWRMPSLRDLFAFGGTLLIAIAPLYYTWWVNGNPLLPRYNIVGEDTSSILDVLRVSPRPLASLSHMVEEPLLFYTHIPEAGPFYMGDYALLLPLLVPLFLVGMGYALLRLWRPGPALIFWWVIGAAVANVFIAGRPLTPRYAIVFPALVIACAVGGCHIVRLLGVYLPWWRRWRPAVKPLLLAALLGIALAQGSYYLFIHMPGYYYWHLYHRTDNGVRTRDFDDALLRVVELPTNTDAHIYSRGIVSPTAFGSFLVYFNRTDPEDLRLDYKYNYELRESELVALPRTRNHAFFIAPDDRRTYEMLTRYFVLEGPYFSDNNIPPERQFAMYFAPVEQNINHPGVYEYNNRRHTPDAAPETVTGEQATDGPADQAE